VKTLILGLGNELFGDDGVGIHVIRELKKRGGFKSNIDLVETSVSGLALLDIIANYDRLVIIDTIKRENPKPGSIRLINLNQIRHVPGPSPHYVSFPQIITLGKKFGLKMPKLVKIIAVEAKSIYHLGEELSPEVKSAIPEIINKINELIEEWEKK
jgi:hydrogenase maturation protease